MRTSKQTIAEELYIYIYNPSACKCKSLSLESTQDRDFLNILEEI